ncbi:hypothetical protein MXB_1245 [Myxobolus squamalis]|nr:hypothetical protein MXB_1245 [Myxobolus squamalis]
MPMGCTQLIVSIQCFIEKNQFVDFFFVKLYETALNQEIDLVRKQLQEIITISNWSCLLPVHFYVTLESLKLRIKQK